MYFVASRDTEPFLDQVINSNNAIHLLNPFCVVKEPLIAKLVKRETHGKKIVIYV